jgi:transposase
MVQNRNWLKTVEFNIHDILSLTNKIGVSGAESVSRMNLTFEFSETHLLGQPSAHVICEATGGYEQPVVRALRATDIPVTIVEAGRVRYFARAQGQRAKTDPIDSAVLTRYGVTFKPAPTRGVSAQQQRLADVAQRRPPAPKNPGKTNRPM